MLRLRGTIIILSLFLLVNTTNSVQAQTQTKNEPIYVIQQYINSIDKHNWYAIPNLWVKDSELVDFIQSKQNQKYKYGLLGRLQAKL